MDLNPYRDYCKVKDQFKVRADSFDDSARWVKDKNLLDIHQNLAGASNGNLILELCCGTGVVGERFLQGDSRIVGLDISLPMLKKAKSRLSFCINGVAEHLPFLDGIFDIALCRQAWHFLDTRLVIKEMFRILKPKSGRAIISQIVPFGKEDSSWLYQIHHKKQPLLKNFLQEEDLNKLLKDAGFLDISSSEYYVEESINNWLKDTYFTQAAIDDIKKMYVEAPEEYKALHHTKVINGDILDTMRWVVVRGWKP